MTYPIKPFSITFGIYAGSFEHMAPKHEIKAVLSLEIAHLSGLFSPSATSSGSFIIFPKISSLNRSL
jgi:hypothetical protein